MLPAPARYFLAVFDVLGFKQKFDALGLAEIARRYGRLIDVVDKQNRRIEELFGGSFRLRESAYWVASGELVIVNKVFGAYASDSILIWAHSLWSEGRDKTSAERADLATDPATGWMYRGVPCDVLVEVCNELICHSIEAGLPLRGALAMGDTALDLEHRVFLGAPLIEAATLERGQRMIGASFCPSFMNQTIPGRFRLSFDAHVKEEFRTSFGGATLDWPRHWRKTRQGSPRPHIRRLGRGANDRSIYYDNTLSLCDLSDQWRDMHESPEDVSIQSVYEAFSSPELEASVIPVRSVAPQQR